MPAQNIIEKIAKLYKMEIQDVAEFVIKNPDVLNEEVCKYLIENPEFYELDVFEFPHFKQIVEGILNGVYVKSELNENVIKHKIELLKLTYSLNAKMLKRESIPLEEMNEDMILEAMQVGLINGKIGNVLELQYCRPKTNQKWLLEEIAALKKRLISTLQ